MPVQIFTDGIIIGATSAWTIIRAIILPDMPAEPLPTNLTLLEELLKACSANYDQVLQLLHRDRARRDMIRDCIIGRISPAEMQRRRDALENTAQLQADLGGPTKEFLIRYIDPNDVAKAEFRVSFGIDATAQGIELLGKDARFASMIVSGYESVVLGHLMRLDFLRRLREDVVAAVQNQTRPKTESPVWDAEVNRLYFRGQQIRRVRTKQVAGNIRLILDAFQCHGTWPSCVEAPKDFTPETLREAVRGLNRGLRLIKFRSDQGGKVVCWEAP
jgi:hypothetical protein